MLVVSGIIWTCLSGLLLTGIIGTRFSWTERIGLSFPLGMTLQTVVMALLDLMHIPLTSFSVLSAGAVTFALLMFIVARYRGFESFRITSAMLDDWKQTNLVWVLLIILIGYCEYMNFSKCMFFPPSDRDSLAAFDTLGFVAAQDHTYMRMSLFDADYNPSIHRAGGSIAYAPFVQMSYAYVYIRSRNIEVDTGIDVFVLCHCFLRNPETKYRENRRRTVYSVYDDGSRNARVLVVIDHQRHASHFRRTGYRLYRQLATQP